MAHSGIVSPENDPVEDSPKTKAPALGSVFLDSDEPSMTRRMFQERVAAIVVMFLLIGFVLQYWIYSRSTFWLEPEGHLGNLLLTTVVVAVILFVLLIFRWRSLRRDYAVRIQLDRQLHLLKEAVETMDIGITISDARGRVLFANQAQAAMHGTTIDQLLARNSGGQQMASEDTVDGFATILAGGHSKTESVHSRANGRDFPVQLISNAVLDPGGTPIGVVTSCEDISDRKRAESELEENRRQLRGLALHLENLRDKERTQIAHEIHNDLGAALTVLKINLTLIESELARLESDQLERAHRMSEDIDAMIDLIRSISRQLRPFLLDDVGLIAAVDALVDDLKRKTDITFELDLPPTEPTLKPEEKETLFRTFQEGTTNSLRHANADRIRARLQVAADRIILEITDDGKGLKADPLKSHSAFGLLGLQERVRSLDGEMLVGPSDTGPGTTLRVTLPQKQGGRE